MQLPAWLLKTDGRYVLRVAGVLILILGVLNLLGIVLFLTLAPTLGIDIMSLYSSGIPFKEFVVTGMELLTTILELVAGVLAFYFAKHREKHGLATLTAMLLVGVSVASANLASDFNTKLTSYIMLIVPYMYYFGALLHQGMARKDEKESYEAQIEEYKGLYEAEREKNAGA